MEIDYEVGFCSFTAVYYYNYSGPAIELALSDVRVRYRAWNTRLNQLNEDIENLQYRLSISKTTTVSYARPSSSSISYIGQEPRKVRFCPVERYSQLGGCDAATDTGVRVDRQCTLEVEFCVCDVDKIGGGAILQKTILTKFLFKPLTSDQSTSPKPLNTNPRSVKR